MVKLEIIGEPCLQVGLLLCLIRVVKRQLSSCSSIADSSALCQFSFHITQDGIEE